MIAVQRGFTVETEAVPRVLARMGGELVTRRIRVVLGDRVTVAVSPYDPSRGRIVYRHR